MKLFYDLKSHLKPFDLKKIKDLKNNHPFQRIMVMTNKLYRNYQMGVIMKMVKKMIIM